MAGSRGHDIRLPATFVVASDGGVLFAYANPDYTYHADPGRHPGPHAVDRMSKGADLTAAEVAPRLGPDGEPGRARPQLPIPAALKRCGRSHFDCADRSQRTFNFGHVSG
jgi:hypothetical protein